MNQKLERTQSIQDLNTTNDYYKYGSSNSASEGEPHSIRQQ